MTLERRFAHEPDLSDRVVVAYGAAQPFVSGICPRLQAAGARVIERGPTGAATEPNIGLTLSDPKLLAAELDVLLDGCVPTDVVFAPSLTDDGTLCGPGDLTVLRALVNESVVSLVHLIQVLAPRLRTASETTSSTVTALVPASGAHLVAGRARSGIVAAALGAAVRQFAHELGSDRVRTNIVLLSMDPPRPEAADVGGFLASLIAFGRMITAETFDLSGRVFDLSPAEVFARAELTLVASPEAP